MLVVKQPSLSPELELNRFGIGQDFVIPDHAAVTRQDIRGEVRVDLIRIGVLGQVLFNTEIKAPEPSPVCFADLVRDSLRHDDRYGIRLQLLEVGNGALLQIHFQAHRDGGLRRLLCGLWKAAEPHTLALANRARANADFDAGPRGRLVQGEASRWRFGMMAASIPYNYSYAAHCMLMNEWRFESPTNRRQRLGKSSQRGH